MPSMLGAAWLGGPSTQKVKCSIPGSLIEQDTEPLIVPDEPVGT